MKMKAKIFVLNYSVNFVLISEKDFFFFSV